MIRNALLCLAAAAFTGSLFAQTTTPPTKLERELSKVDFGIAGIGQFNSDVKGQLPNNGCSVCGNPATNTPPHTIGISAGNTAGALANIRYTAKPYFGVEFNYTYARYTETLTDYTAGGALAPGQIQTGVDEMSFGYLITPKHQFFGLQPVISLGAGSTRFRPTRGGGESSPTQWRATYFYSVGLQKEFGDSHFGARVAMRQAFFKAPDFLLNYLTINQHTTTYEPTIGFYVRF